MKSFSRFVYYILAVIIVPLISFGLLLAPALQPRRRPLVTSAPTPVRSDQTPEARRGAAPPNLEIVRSRPTLEASPKRPEITPTSLEPILFMDPDAISETICGGPPTMMILAIGADSREDSYLYGLADVIRAVRLDFSRPEIAILTFPRDIWVEIPEIEDHYGITHGKLNQAYLYGGPGMGYYEGPDGGPGLLSLTLDVNFGLRSDHYVAVNMLTFVKIVDAVDGITIDLPEAVDGRPAWGSTEKPQFFAAGKHYFDGDQALTFARLRNNYDDIYRSKNQNLVLSALWDKIISPEVLPHIPELVRALKNSVRTDLRPSQIAQLGGRTSVFQADFTAIRKFVGDFQTGRLTDDT